MNKEARNIKTVLKEYVSKVTRNRKLLDELLASKNEEIEYLKSQIAKKESLNYSLNITIDTAFKSIEKYKEIIETKTKLIQEMKLKGYENV